MAFHVLAVTVVVFWTFGFALTFGEGPGWIGLRGFVPRLIGESSGFIRMATQHVPLSTFFVFTLAYVDTACDDCRGHVR